MLHMAVKDYFIDLDAESVEPTWGEKLRIIRQRVWSSAPKLQAALEDIGLSTSEATISRMEHSLGVPTSKSQRRIATAILLLVRKDPAILGLDADELPTGTLWLIAQRVGAPDPGGPEAPGGTPPGTRTRNLRNKREAQVLTFPTPHPMPLPTAA